MQRKCSRNLDELKEIVAMTGRLFDECDIDPAKRPVVDLCIEEIFVNMVTYDTETSEQILIEMAPHGSGVEVSLTDFGVDRFDPRRVAPVDIDAPLEKREPGGLGLFLVMKMVDSINYEYKDRVSRITFVAGGK